MQHTLANFSDFIKKVKLSFSLTEVVKSYIRQSKQLIKPTENGFLLRIVNNKTKVITVTDGISSEKQELSLDEFKSLAKTNPTLPINIILGDVDFKIYRCKLPIYKFFERGMLRTQVQQSEYQPDDWLTNHSKVSSIREIETFLYAVRSQPHYQLWIDEIIKIENPFSGISIWPVESAIKEKELMQSNQTEVWSNVTWLIVAILDKDNHLYISVFHNGNITFFRNIPKVMFADIEKEVSQTINYLSRFGHKNDDKVALTLLDDNDEKFEPTTKSISFFRRKKLETSAKGSLSFNSSICFIPEKLKNSYIRYAAPPKILFTANRLIIAGTIVIILQLLQMAALYKRNSDESIQLKKAELKLPESLPRILREIDLFDNYIDKHPQRLSHNLPKITSAVQKYGIAKKIFYKHHRLSIIFQKKNKRRKVEDIQNNIMKSLKKLKVNNTVTIDHLTKNTFNLIIKFDHASQEFKF